jgi:general secretion pathway protein B
MSYILDALRKADAQRERDPARGIHAQTLHAAGERRLRSGFAPWVWGASVLGVAAAAGAGWLVYQDRTAVAAAPPARVEVAVPAVTLAAAPAPAPVVATAVQPPPPPPAPATPRGLRMTSQPMGVGAPQAGSAGTQIYPAPAPPAIAPAPGAVPPAAAPAPGMEQPAAPGQPATPQMMPTPPAAPPATQTAPGARPATPTPAQAAAAAAAAAPAAAPVAGLPPDAPKLAISGGVYSTNPTQRMLIVNGQVFNEGSEIGPGVVLEQIKPKAAVLKFRNASYTVSY